MSAPSGTNATGAFVNRREASGWRNSALTDQERKLMQTISNQMGLKKGRRQQAVRDQDRERAMVRGVVYRSTLETALQHQVALSDAERMQHAAEDLQRLTDVYERRVCRIGEAHAEAAAYMQQQQEARLAQEQRLSELNELQVQRFQSAISMVKAQKGAAKAQTQQQQQHRAEILRAEREKAQSFSAEQADRAQAQKRRHQDLARRELERRKRSANGLSVDFRNTRLHEGQGAPGPVVVPAVVAPQVPVIPDPVVSAEELEHRAAVERRRREMAAAEAEFRARERFLAAQAKLRADAQKQAVEAELAELAAQRLQAKKHALAGHRMRIQDQRKQQELQRVFEENFLPSDAALDDDLAPRALPAFLQPTPPAAAAAEGAVAPAAKDPGRAALGAQPLRPVPPPVPPPGPGPRWSKGRTAPLGRNPPPLPAWPALIPEPPAPSREEVAVQTEPDLMAGSPDQQRPRHQNPSQSPQHAPEWFHESDPFPRIQPQSPATTATSASQEPTPYTQDTEPSPYTGSSAPRRLAWPPGPPESAADFQSPSRHGAPSSPTGATVRVAAARGRDQASGREDPRTGKDGAETMTPGTHELEDGEDGESEEWGDDAVDRELERMKLELGIDDTDLCSSTTSLISSISMPTALLSDMAQRAGGQRAKEETAVRSASGSGAAQLHAPPNAPAAQQQAAEAGGIMQPGANRQTALGTDASEQKHQQPSATTLLQNLVTDQRPGMTVPQDMFQPTEDKQALGAAFDNRQRGLGMGAAQSAAARPPVRTEAFTPAAARQALPPAGAGKGAIAPSPTDTLDSSILRLLDTPSSLASTPAAAAGGAGAAAAAAAGGRRAAQAAARLDMTPGAASSLPSDLDDVLLLSELDWDELEVLAGLRGGGGARGPVGGASAGTTPARGVGAGAGGGGAAASVSPSTSTLSTVSGVSDESIRRLVAQGILPPEIAALLATTPSDMSTVGAASTPAEPTVRQARHEPSGPPPAVPSPTASSSLSGLSALLAAQTTSAFGKHPPPPPSLPATSDLASLQAASSLSSLSAYLASLPRGPHGAPGGAPAHTTAIGAAAAAASQPHGPVHAEPRPCAGLYTIPEGRPVGGTAPSAAVAGAAPTLRPLASELADLSAAASRLLGSRAQGPLGGAGAAARGGNGILSGLSEPVRLTLADLNRNLLAAAGAARNNQPAQGPAAPSPSGRPGKPGPMIISSLDDPPMRKPMQPPAMLQPPPLLQPPRAQASGAAASPPAHQAPDSGPHGWGVSASDLSSMSSSLSLSPPRRAPGGGAPGRTEAAGSNEGMAGAAAGAAAVPSLTTASNASMLSSHGPDDVTSNTPMSAATPVTTDATSREAGKSPYDMYDREAAKLTNLMASIAASLRQSSQAVARAGRRQASASPMSPPAAAADGGSSALLSGGTTPSSTLDFRHDTGLSTSPSTWTLAPSSQGGITFGTPSPVAAMLSNDRAASPGPTNLSGSTAKAAASGAAVQGRGAGTSGKRTMDAAGGGGGPSTSRPGRAPPAPLPIPLSAPKAAAARQGGASGPPPRSPIRAPAQSPVPTTPSSLSSPRYMSSTAANSPNDAAGGGAASSRMGAFDCVTISPSTTPTPPKPPGHRGAVRRRVRRSPPSPGTTSTAGTTSGTPASSVLSLSSVLALIRQQQGLEADNGEGQVGGGGGGGGGGGQVGSPGRTARKAVQQRSPEAQRRKRRQQDLQPTSPPRRGPHSPGTETFTRSPSTSLSPSHLRQTPSSPQIGMRSPPTPLSPSFTESSFDSMALTSITPLSAAVSAPSEPAAAPQPLPPPPPLHQQQRHQPPQQMATELSAAIQSAATDSMKLSGGLSTSDGLSSIAAAIAGQLARRGGGAGSSSTTSAISSASLTDLTRVPTGPSAHAPMRDNWPADSSDGYESPTSTPDGSRQYQQPQQQQTVSPQRDPMQMGPIAAQSPVRVVASGPAGRRGDVGAHGSPNAPVDVWASLTGQSLEDALAGLVTPASGQYDDLLRSSLALSISSTGLDASDGQDDEGAAEDPSPQQPPLPQQRLGHRPGAPLPDMSSEEREEMMGTLGHGSRALSDSNRSLRDVAGPASSAMYGGAAPMPAPPSVDRSRLAATGSEEVVAASDAQGAEVARDGRASKVGELGVPTMSARLGSDRAQLGSEEGIDADREREQGIALVDDDDQEASSYELLAAADSLLAQAASSVAPDSQAASNLQALSDQLPTTTTTTAANLPPPGVPHLDTSATHDSRVAIPPELRSSGDSDEFGTIMAGLLKDIQRGLATLQVAALAPPPSSSAPPALTPLILEDEDEQQPPLRQQQLQSPGKQPGPQSPQQKRPWEEMMGGQDRWGPAGPGESGAQEAEPDGLAAEPRQGLTDAGAGAATSSGTSAPSAALGGWLQGGSVTGGSMREEPSRGEEAARELLGSSSTEDVADGGMEGDEAVLNDGGRDGAEAQSVVGSGAMGVPQMPLMSNEGRQTRTSLAPGPFSTSANAARDALGELSGVVLQHGASSDQGGREANSEQSSIVWWPDPPLLNGRIGGGIGGGGGGAGERSLMAEWLPYIEPYVPSAAARGDSKSAREGETPISSSSSASSGSRPQLPHALVTFPTFSSMFMEGLSQQSPLRSGTESEALRLGGVTAASAPSTSTTTGPPGGGHASERDCKQRGHRSPVAADAPSTREEALAARGPDPSDAVPPRPPHPHGAAALSSHPHEPSASTLAASGAYSFSQPPRAFAVYGRLAPSIQSRADTESGRSGGSSTTGSVSSISSLDSLTEALELARYPVFGGATQSPMGSPSTQDSGSDDGAAAAAAPGAATTASAGVAAPTSTSASADRTAKQQQNTVAGLTVSTVRVPIQFMPAQKPASPPSPTDQEPWRGAWDPPLSPSPRAAAAASARTAGATTTMRLQLQNLSLGSPPRSPKVPAQGKAAASSASPQGSVPLSQLRSPPSSPASSSMTVTLAAASEALEATAQGLQNLFRDAPALAAAAALAGSNSDSDLWMDVARWGLGTLRTQTAKDRETIDRGVAAPAAPEAPQEPSFHFSDSEEDEHQPHQPHQPGAAEKNRQAQRTQNSSQAVGLGYLPPEAFQDPDCWGEGTRTSAGQVKGGSPMPAGAHGSTAGASGGRTSLSSGWVNAAAAAGGEPQTPGRPERSSAKTEETLLSHRSSSGGVGVGGSGGVGHAGALSEEQLAGLLMWTVSDFFSSPGSGDE